MSITKENIEIIKWDILQITLWFLYLVFVSTVVYAINLFITSTLIKTIILIIFLFIFWVVPIYNMMVCDVF